MADEDLIIEVDTLDEPFDTTTETAKPAARTEPVRLKVPGRDTPKPAERADGGVAITADDPVENLRGQINALTQRASTAERRAAEVEDAANREIGRARTVVAGTRVQALETEINSATTESASLKAAQKAAYDAGDFARATELNEQMADVRARLFHAKQQKEALEASDPAARRHEGAVRQPVAPQPARRGEPTAEERRQAILATCSPASRQWLENHPDILDDPERGSMAQVVHHRAVKQGITPDTPEYFRFAEEQLGYTKGSTTRRQNNMTTTPARGSRVEAAPVDRGSAGGSDGGSSAVRVSLTQGEAAAATDGTHVWNYGPNKGKPIGLKEFARRKAIMESEGRYQNPAVS